MDLGETIREIRERSQFPSRKSFSSHVGLSVEGLRKIEGGRRIPDISTLERILKFGGVSEKGIRSIQVMRARAIAERDGVDIPTFPKGVRVDSSELETLARELVHCFYDYLERHENDLLEGWEEELSKDLEVVLRRGVNGIGISVT